MNWQFRTSFKIIPGIRLRVSRSGISATFGAVPFTFDVNSQDSNGTISLQKAGLSHRQLPDVLSLNVHTPKLPLNRSSIPVTLTDHSVVNEIRSASTELLNSEGMECFRQVLKKTYEERSALSAEAATAKSESNLAIKQFQKWNHGFLFKRLFKSSFALRKNRSEIAQAKHEELCEQLRLTAIETQIDVDPEQAELYYRMRDDFAALCECRKIWDTLDRRMVNRIVERSAANEEINRAAVSFSLAHCDLINWEQKIPYLPNRNGGDLYIYPGFLLYRASQQAFALLNSREVKLTFRSSRFIEQDPVPSDSQIVGSAWAKSNKDGSRDRRFRDNYQIPVALYGSLTFTSPSGLYEEYQFSNAGRAEKFAISWNRFQSSFAAVSEMHSKYTAKSSKRKKLIAPPFPISSSMGSYNVAVAFAEESDVARELVSKGDPYWEYLLTAELMSSKLSQAQEFYNQQFRDLPLAQTSRFTALDYLAWLREILDKCVSLNEQVAMCINQKILQAWGEIGETGNALKILDGVNEIIAICEQYMELELQVRSVEPPPKLKPLGTTLPGFTETFIKEIRRLPCEIRSAIEHAKAGLLSGKLIIKLVFETPRQITMAQTEMDKIAKHPERLLTP